MTYVTIQDTQKSWWIAVQVHQSFTIRLYIRMILILETLPRISCPWWLDRFRRHTIKIKLPEFSFTAHIFAPYHVTSQKSNCNIIFGQNLLRELGINLDFQNDFIRWKEIKIPMKSINCKMRTNFVIQESKNVKSTTKRIKKIYDAKYE